MKDEELRVVGALVVVFAVFAIVTLIVAAVTLAT